MSRAEDIIKLVEQEEDPGLTSEEELEGYRLARMDAYDRMKANPKNKVAKAIFQAADREYRDLLAKHSKGSGNEQSQEFS